MNQVYDIVLALTLGMVLAPVSYADVVEPKTGARLEGTLKQATPAGLVIEVGGDGKLYAPEIDIAVNDLSLPLWAAIPPRQAARLAIETAEALDRRLEGFPSALVEEIHARNQRWVVRALHRNEHLDEVVAALRS